jgi:hypothetical protein
MFYDKKRVIKPEGKFLPLSYERGNMLLVSFCYN